MAQRFHLLRNLFVLLHHLIVSSFSGWRKSRSPTWSRCPMCRLQTSTSTKTWPGPDPWPSCSSWFYFSPLILDLFKYLMILGYWFMFMRIKLINISVLPQQFGTLALKFNWMWINIQKDSKRIISGLWIYRWAMSIVMSSKERSPEAGFRPPESRSRVLGVIAPLSSLLSLEMGSVDTLLSFFLDLPPIIRCITDMILCLTWELKQQVAGSLRFVLMEVGMVYLCCSSLITLILFFLFVYSEFSGFFSLISEKCFSFSSGDWGCYDFWVCAILPVF